MSIGKPNMKLIIKFSVSHKAARSELGINQKLSVILDPFINQQLSISSAKLKMFYMKFNWIVKQIYLIKVICYM